MNHEQLINAGYSVQPDGSYSKSITPRIVAPQTKRIRHANKPLLNKLEADYCAYLEARGERVLKQAITLRLDPPFKSYRPDLAYIRGTYLTFIECKGPHRFREKGIAKVALAAKTYPMFCFILVERVDGRWKETVMTP